DEPVLAPESDDVADLAVAIEHRRGDEVQVLPVLVRRLVPPFEGAGARIENDDRVGEQVGAWTVILVDIGPGVADRDEQLPGRDIERQCAPYTAAPGLGRLGPNPGL